MNVDDALLGKCYVVQQFHDDGHATLLNTEGVIFDEAQALPFLQAIYPSADIRRADCDHVAFNLFANGKETDTVWLTEFVPCAGQAHADARLLAALEPFAKAGDLFAKHENGNRDALIYAPAAGREYYLDSGHLLDARAAIAAAKGTAE